MQFTYEQSNASNKPTEIHWQFRRDHEPVNATLALTNRYQQHWRLPSSAKLQIAAQNLQIIEKKKNEIPNQNRKKISKNLKKKRHTPFQIYIPKFPANFFSLSLRFHHLCNSFNFNRTNAAAFSVLVSSRGCDFRVNGTIDSAPSFCFLSKSILPLRSYEVFSFESQSWMLAGSSGYQRRKYKYSWLCSTSDNWPDSWI